MIRYYKIIASNGYCGCTRTEYLEHDDEIDMDIEEIAWDITVENAESYAHCAFGWGQIPPEDSDEYQSYIENCNFSVQEVTKEEYEKENKR